jgi:arylsulfatase A-like enzyme
MTTLFTGLHPIRHSVTRKTFLSEHAVTLAESLQNAGMNTVGVSLNPNVSQKTGLHQGFDVFEEMRGSRTLAYKSIHEMMRVIRMWYYGGPKDSYFLFMLPMNVHGPYKVPKKRRKDLLSRAPVKGFKYLGNVMKGVMRGDDAKSAREKFTPEMLQSLQEKYANAVRYSTDKLSKFFEFLKEEGYYDEALIIVPADHGEELYDHGGFSHGYTLHNELLHVPLYVKLPFQTDAKVVEERVTLADVYPTIMDILELEKPRGIDGVSFANLVDGETWEKAPGIWAEETEVFSVAWPKRCVGHAILDWPWKLIWIDTNYEGRENETLLFNLEKDPGETENLAVSRPDLVKKLAKKMKEGVSCYGKSGNWAKDTKMDEEMEARLKALGYLQ